MQIEQMPMVRVFFEKSGRAKYTSHLDVMRMFTRALRRSGLPVWYTQGFNPHLYMTFALPIALGCESRCESLDLRLTEEMPGQEVVEKINSALPAGFRALEAGPPVLAPAAIAWAEYAVTLRCADGEALCRELEAFMARPAIEVEKRTKKGPKLVDIKPLSTLLACGPCEEGAALRLRLAAGNTVNIAPALLLQAFAACRGGEPCYARIVREAVLTEALEAFR